MAERADVLIVGGGSSGCVVANRLSADPSRRVVVVEAGHAVADPDVRRPELWPVIQGRDFDWAYETVPQPGLAGRSVAWPRGRGLGGSSNLHAMAHMRGDASDFAAWAEAAGDPRWSWAGLQPYFRAMEHFTPGHGEDRPDLHGNDGPLPVLLPGNELLSPLVGSYLEAWESLGIPRIADHNHGSMIGATPNALTIAAGSRVTAADAYLWPVLGRSNLEVVGNALVHRLLLSRNRVRGIEFSHTGGHELETLEATKVILAAGSVGDPLLLMRSGIGDPEMLTAAGVPVAHPLPGVGRNLHDHLLGAGVLYRSRRHVPPSRLQLSEAMTYLPEDGPGSAGSPEVVVGCVTVPSVSESLTARVETLAGGDAYTLLFGVTHPTSRGSLRITGPGPDADPVIDPAYLSTGRDRTAFRRALELARLVGGSKALASWRSEEILPGPAVDDPTALDEFIAEAAITHHHPVGTCRMGTDEIAVVDAELRVRGVDGLHVVDASVFPSITTGPVHAAVLAVAESFASRLQQ